MQLNELKDNDGATKNRKRVGRGIGSTKGKTCGRGVKGQKSRTGVSINGFEGGQMPIYRRLPKRGFKNYNRVEFATVNLAELQRALDAKKLDAKKTITREALQAAGVLRTSDTRVKLLSNGELKTKLTIEVCKASKAAIAAVEKAGGSVVCGADKAAA
jgi:large subunit ribosomal protein L15